MTVSKDNTEFNVDQLSDGEKCTLALFGDLARRLAIANQNSDYPLEGSGIVLIDEIELHMHPSWQRKVLSTLKRIFPNIQFIITTHSPQVLGDVDDNYNLFALSNETGKDAKAVLMKRMDGYDSNFILEEYMQTLSVNPLYKKKYNDVKKLIDENRFDEAESAIKEISLITDLNHSDVILLENMLLKRRMIYDKNH